MSPRRKASQSAALLELWRPPKGAGDPIGCLATTYTFQPALYDEQCLARFLEIESEPNREDLSFLLERESRLGSVYAGVLVDHTQAGVEHSLRWDVLPVRVPGGKQHAKLSVLLWARHARVIVSSANLTEQGYRYNFETAAFLDATPDGGNVDAIRDALQFLKTVPGFVAVGTENPVVVQRALQFIKEASRRVEKWTGERRAPGTRQRLVFTVPGRADAARSTVDECLDECRSRGGSPFELWVASPFFDDEEAASDLMARVAKGMARQYKKRIDICLPAQRDKDVKHPRLLAPKSLWNTASKFADTVNIEMLPAADADRNPRPWHAKLMLLRGDGYVGVLAGSANFTAAAMGTGERRNIEAGLLTVLDRNDPEPFEELWPDMVAVTDPHAAEWIGRSVEQDEEEKAGQRPVPPGFLLATYFAGAQARIELVVSAGQLPGTWTVRAPGANGEQLFSSDDWLGSGQPACLSRLWTQPGPPEWLIVQWEAYQAPIPINVHDQRDLPPPSQLQHMTADDMLGILAASDPGAAFRVWARARQQDDAFDPELDSASPVDLDPLRLYDLHSTFLHRIRRRARVLAAVRANLQRPASGRQVVEWRLRGLVGIQPLADRLLAEYLGANARSDEALLTLADFLLAMTEVRYETADGAMSRREFDDVYRPFLTELAQRLSTEVASSTNAVSADAVQFWKRVVQRCRE